MDNSRNRRRNKYICIKTRPVSKRISVTEHKSLYKARRMKHDMASTATTRSQPTEVQPIVRQAVTMGTKLFNIQKLDIPINRMQRYCFPVADTTHQATVSVLCLAVLNRMRAAFGPSPSNEMQNPQVSTSVSYTAPLSSLPHNSCNHCHATSCHISSFAMCKEWTDASKTHSVSEVCMKY